MTTKLPHSLDSLIKDGTVFKGTDDKLKIVRFTTGLADLDAILGGGLPRRRISVLAGTYSCVPPETIIDTEIGRLPIKTIVDMRLPVRVWSMNTSTGEWGLKPLRGWIKRPQSKPFVRVGSLRLTPDHEVWTREFGYVPAADLIRSSGRYSILKAGGKNVKGLVSQMPQSGGEYEAQGTVPAGRNLSHLHRLPEVEEGNAPPALLELFGQMASSRTSGVYRKGYEPRDTEEAVGLFQGDDERPFSSSLGALEWGAARDESYLGESSSQEPAPSNGRIRTGTSLATDQTIPGFGGRLAQRICSENRQASPLSSGVQDRRGSPRTEDCYRSSGTPQRAEDDMVRREWVDAAVVLEQAGGGLGGGLSSDGYIYDLTVEDNHNFIANGILVSNSGKTLITQFIVKAAMAAGLEALYIDTEQTYDPEWWEKCGVDIDNLRVSQPASGDAAIRLALAAGQAGVDLVVLDSVAAIYPKEAAEHPEKEFPGYRARMLNRFCEGFLAAKPDTAYVLVNQMRDSFANVPMPLLDSMPGGRGLRHYTGIILRVLREGWIKEKEVRQGFNIRVICSKNKVGTPFGECVLPFRFRGEIDMLALLAERGIDAGVIRQNGPWYYIGLGGEEQKVSGKTNLVELLREQDNTRQLLEVALGDL